ncbi:ABC transporter ATP-binding protein [Brevibacterium daeguense]|uniref:ABC transporter ATP-binding protein n=1 Tax=Brevibacterium daeguense TaxID=909936 RepID=A0ABP8EM77_9MICO|nr:ABC transporter ATP-binding protein [Brevibacterium daeguense]
MTESLLTVQDLEISAGQRHLVHPTSFTIAAGERVGLIGESGSGKSLTSAAVMGLLPGELSARGQVKLSGTEGNLLTWSERRMARLRGRDLSMVFQEPMSALNPLMRVGEQVAEVMRIHRTANPAQAKARAVELLERVRLPDPRAAARAYPHQLSGGQRQRVMLAIAMANSPRLLICDEPTTALDVTVQAQVLDLIREAVVADGTGLLFITHDLAVVASVCERVMVMYRGRIVESGSCEQIFTDPQHEYTRGLLAASDLTATDDRGRLFTIASAARYRSHASGDGAMTDAEADAGSASRAAPVDLATGEPLIEVSELVKTYSRTRTSLFGRADRVEALRGISLSIPAGRRFGIVGESGSGKSTLLKILSGLEPPTTGSVQVGGVHVESATSAQLRSMREDLQIVFQDPFASLDPRMKVADIIAEPLVPMRVPERKRRERVAETLAAVGLEPESAHRFPHQFSGGQRQRISIARALVCRPRILVADEPVSALDVSVRAQVLNLLTDLVDEYQLTLVFVSHDLGVVRHLCSDVAVMKSGEIVETGDVESIYTNPQHPYTASLVAATPSLEDAFAAS